MSQFRDQNKPLHSCLTTGRWRRRRRRCSPSCLPWASGQTCPGWCWRGSRHQGGSTGAGPSGRWSTSSATPAHRLYHPANSSSTLWSVTEDFMSHLTILYTAVVVRAHTLDSVIRVVYQSALDNRPRYPENRSVDPTRCVVPKAATPPFCFRGCYWGQIRESERGMTPVLGNKLDK